MGGQVDLTGARWCKSSYSSGNGQCVEVAPIYRRVAVRDSKNPGGGALVLTPKQWAAFVGGIRSGAFD